MDWFYPSFNDDDVSNYSLFTFVYYWVSNWSKEIQVFSSNSLQSFSFICFYRSLFNLLVCMFCCLLKVSFCVKAPIVNYKYYVGRTLQAKPLTRKGDGFVSQDGLHG